MAGFFRGCTWGLNHLLVWEHHATQYFTGGRIWRRLSTRLWGVSPAVVATVHTELLPTTIHPPWSKRALYRSTLYRRTMVWADGPALSSPMALSAFLTHTMSYPPSPISISVMFTLHKCFLPSNFASTYCDQMCYCANKPSVP